MSTTTTEQPAASHPAQRLALAPFVERVRTWCEEHGGEENAGSFELRCAGRVLSFEAPEFALLYHSALIATETGQAKDRLAVDAVALELKSIEDLARRRASTDEASTEYNTAQAELILDGVLGTALLAEIQARIDELVAQGELDPSKILGKFNHRVWNVVAQVERLVASSECERSRVLEESLRDRPPTPTPAQPKVSAATAPSVPEPPESLDLDAGVLSLTREASAAHERRSRPVSSLTLFLAVGLLAATLIWLALFSPFGSGSTASRELTLDSFGGRLTGIDARAPSLFGLIDRTHWEQLDPAARLELVDEVAQVLARSGYSGALIRTADGVPVAQWLRDRGPLLLEDLELP